MKLITQNKKVTPARSTELHSTTSAETHIESASMKGTDASATDTATTRAKRKILFHKRKASDALPDEAQQAEETTHASTENVTPAPDEGRRAANTAHASTENTSDDSISSTLSVAPEDAKMFSKRAKVAPAPGEEKQTTGKAHAHKNDVPEIIVADKHPNSRSDTDRSNRVPKKSVDVSFHDMVRIEADAALHEL